MRSDVGPSGRRLEHLRYWASGAIGVLCLVSLAFGPVGWFFIGWLLGALFLFGFELSRPIAATLEHDRRWAGIVRALLLFFLPVVIFVIIMDAEGSALVAEREQEFPWYYNLIFASAFATGIGSLLAAVHILRQRGPKRAWRNHLRSLWISPFGLPLLALPAGPIWYIAPTLIAAPILGLFGHALYRIWVPVYRPATVPETRQEPVQPSFAQFRG